MVEERLLKILRCPLGKAKLREEGNWLICEKCGVRYPIRDGIPVMLIHEATLPAGVKDVKELRCQKEEEKA